MVRKEIYLSPSLKTSSLFSLEIQDHNNGYLRLMNVFTTQERAVWQSTQTLELAFPSGSSNALPIFELLTLHTSG